MSEGNKTIAAALLVAQKAAEAVGKTSRNEFAKFNYASAESMIAECRGALHEAGLVVVGGDQDLWVSDGETVLISDFHVIHESGETLKCVRKLPVCVGKGKPLDKAMLGAATESLGYFLRDLLLIPRQEVDVSGRDDTKHKPSQKRKAPAQSEKPAKSQPENVAKALGWIEEAGSDKTALDECAKMIAEMGLEGDDRSKVLAAFRKARS